MDGELKKRKIKTNLGQKNLGDLTNPKSSTSLFMFYY